MRLLATNQTVLLVVHVLLVSCAYGLVCYECSDSSFDGETTYAGTCFTVNGSATYARTCPADTYSEKYYCRTRFQLQDGIPTYVYRGCVSGTSDEDGTTKDMPSSAKCQTILSTYNPIDDTNCYYHCNTDRCNTIMSRSLRYCASECSRGINRGYCNYITGECVCRFGYSGSDCSTRTTAPTLSIPSRRCVQCNSDTDQNCVSSTTGSECPGGERYCSTVQTTIYEGTGTAVRTVMTRGCTTSFQAVDECEFTNIYPDAGIQSSGYNEFTCYSTCDTDNCNTNMPDGIVNGNEKVVLHCSVCSGIGSCASSTSRVPCPSDSTYCKSTVSYYVSEKTDLSYTEIPAYKLVSVVRECASAPVTKQCTESKFGILSFKKVTCQETCQEDGCNTGWPARPTCIQCKRCRSNPGLPSACHYPYQRYCYKTESGMNDGITESRGCAHFDMGNGCSSPWSTGIQSCNYTCTTDGCNGSGRLVLGNGALIIAIISSWLAKKMACTGRVA